MNPNSINAINWVFEGKVGTVALPVLPRRLVLLAVGALALGFAWQGTVQASAVTGAVAKDAGAPANTWSPTSPLSVARAGQTATLLTDGDVLVAGGRTASAELYDPAAGTFSTTGSMSQARTDAIAVLLSDGDVLVAGGAEGSTALNSAELYDPGSGKWTPTGSMHVRRTGATGTLLSDGDVLVAGGACNGQAYGCNEGSFLGNLASAELYDPAAGTWALTGSMQYGREFQTATLLPGGDVLVVGGFTQCDDDYCSDTKTAELYDPSTGKWKLTGSMSVSREQQSATLLPSGSVLVAGGLNQAGFGPAISYASAELYDPATGRWTSTASMLHVHVGQTATLLPSGWVLVAGGHTAAAQVYEPELGIWVSVGAMSTVRTDQTATLLPDGHVLVTGGFGPDGEPQATAEVFLTGRGPLVTITPRTLSFGGQLVGTTGRSQSYTVANNGSAALAVSGVTISGAHPGDFLASSKCSDAPIAPGGTCSVSVRFAPTGTGLRQATVAIVDDAPLSPQGAAISGFGGGPNAWVPTGSMSTPREDSTATLLADGDVLVAGGTRGVGFVGLASAELYDPATGTFAPTGSLNVRRYQATATLLADGDVLVVGGRTGDNVLASAELYDPTKGNWTLTGSMNAAGYNLTSMLLPDGDVFVIGVEGVELYDPATGTWSDAASPPALFSFAVLLGDGDVLAGGGNTTAAALYDPATNAWAATGSMNVAREGPTATLLADGEVLVAGGISPNGYGDALSSAELYDPTTGIWTLTEPMSVGRYGQTATLLSNGTVLVAGGCGNTCDSGPVEQSTEVYDNGYFYDDAPMTMPRYQPSATLLADGDLLVVGGAVHNCCDATASAEVYTPTLVEVTPDSGPIGQRITVSGSGLYAGELVTMDWNSGETVASARTNDAGNFVIDTKVPSDVAEGVNTISVRGQRSFGGASTTFEVIG